MDRMAELEARVAYLLAAVEASDDAVLGLDADGRVTSWNRGAQRLFGLTQELALGSGFADLVADQDCGTWTSCFGAARAGSPSDHVELSVHRRDGSTVATSVATSPVRGGDGSPLGVSLVVRDLEEQLLAQSTLADSAQRVAQSEALAHVGSWAWDAVTDNVQWSQEQFHIHGISPGEFDGTLDAQLACVHPNDRSEFARAVKEAFRHGLTLDREFRVVRPGGAVCWVSARASVVVDGGGEAKGLRGIYHDITERHDNAAVLEEANERLTQLALYDRLTGLPNRVLLVDRLGHSLVRGRELGGRVDLLHLGVDDFKTLNDSAGHTVGDRVLTALVPLLGEAGRQVGLPHLSPGGLLARMGGDEFAIVMDGGDPELLAECIHDLLLSPLQLADDQVFVSVSIGNAHVSSARRTVTAEEVISEANIAMREAKRGGKARFVNFEPRMHEAARRRHRLGHELHEALAHDEFVVRYQPVIELGTGEVIGAEALVRWEHPTRGLVGPDSFIPRAEETGSIVPLGAWVLRQACAEAAAWHRETGRPLTIAVNVSGRQLREPDFVDTVRSALAEHGLPAPMLCLEMTESILMERDETGLEMLAALRADGVHLAIDDFGTGYSSLAALRRLPVDQLKIDRSFVAGLPDDPDAATIVWAIVHLGHALGLKVLAEGVEERTQRAELLGFGCDYGQGFLFGRAVSSAEILAEIRNPFRDPDLPHPRVTEQFAEWQP